MSAAELHRHCSYCGKPFAPTAAWPRRCEGCGRTTFRNPVPVTVLLIPVAQGLLVIRRGLPPRQGELALPGGYVNWGESWQEAGAREAYEEAGVRVDAASVSLITVYSAPDGTLIIVGRCDPLDAATLLTFTPTPEVLERRILTAPAVLAWPLHTEMVANYFAQPARVRAG